MIAANILQETTVKTSNTNYNSEDFSSSISVPFLGIWSTNNTTELPSGLSVSNATTETISYVTGTVCMTKAHVQVVIIISLANSQSAVTEKELINYLQLDVCIT